MDEPRYTPTELMNMYFEFTRDKEVRERLNKDGIRWWQDTELTIRFLAYVRNHDFMLRMKEIDAAFARLEEQAEQRKQQFERQQRILQEMRERAQALAERVRRQPKDERFGPRTDGTLFTEEIHDPQ
jgi:hypothetical protein